MKYIGRGCPVLNILNLDDIPDLDDDLILALVNHCTTLRHLSILGGSCITDHSVKRLAIQSKKLRSIKIESKGGSCFLYAVMLIVFILKTTC